MNYLILFSDVISVYIAMQAFLIILCLKVEEAMRINTKLKSINVKQESTITALQKVKKMIILVILTI